MVRGKKEADAVAEITAGYDLLILGAQASPRWREAFRGTGSDRLMRQAACSVLRLKTPRTQTHAVAAASTPDPAAEEAFRLSDHLTEGCLQTGVPAGTKEALFTHFARAFAESSDGVSAEDVEAALWERERTQNTAVDLGMALPHATLRKIDRTYLGVFMTEAPVDHKAPDGRPVDVFFVTLGPPHARGTHLRILAGLSELVLNTKLLADLRKASDSEGIRRAFRAESDSRG